MRISILAAAVVVCAAALAPAALAQNVVSLSPSESAVVLGGTAPLDLEIDFSDASLGGGLVVEFDPARLAFLSFSFDPSSPDDPALRLVCPSASPACAAFSGPGVLVAFAVDTLSLPAISGAHTLGTIRFEALSNGTAALTMREDDSVAGPLVGVAGFAAPSFGSASVATVPFVPALSAPAAAALAAVIALTGFGMRFPAGGGSGEPRYRRVKSA